jgi:regulatory protein
MPTITHLQAANRRASRTFVDLDGEPWAEIDSEIVLRHHLKKGDGLTGEQLAALLADDAFIRARRAAAIMLQGRGRSVAELRRRLRERRHDEASIERVVTHFAAKGDLDDAAFARAYVQRQLRTRCVGPGKVRSQLRQFGVADRDIAAALAEAIDAAPERQAEQARRLLERKMKNPRGLSGPRLRQSLYQALMRAGFEPDLCRELVEEAVRD